MAQKRTYEETDSESSMQLARPESEVIQDVEQSFRNVVKAVRICNAIPQGQQRSLLMTYPGYSRLLDEQSQRMLGMIGRILQTEGVRGNVQLRQSDEQFEMVQECNDIIFERINTNLDTKSAQRRNQPLMVEAPVNVLNNDNSNSTESSLPSTSNAGSWNRRTGPPLPKTARLFTARNILRPQTQFKVAVDNSSQPFMPRLREKPNSLKPLALLPEYNEAGDIGAYLHPYEFELLRFEPPESQLKRQPATLPLPLESVELMLVDTVEKLQQAVEELSKAEKIAIDVEHHSYRTFMGITCLVQMSTSTKDYIFDTLVLREEMHLLNVVLTNPKVLKILHGADMDIEWLQRDLSIYIVNMFDTHRAAKALNLARLSLAFLLKHYVDLNVDKAFQLADWRMRPLPQALIDYARQDTHYLIYIYERLCNDLLNLDNEQPHTLRVVYKRSTELCMKRYVKPHIGPDSHLDLVRKNKRAFDNRQLFALRGIFHWRDATARQEDESYGYVLPNHMMLQIAESLPREMQGILACCNPIPPLVRQQLHTLHQIVLHAREQPLVKPVLEDRRNGPALAHSTKDFNSKLYCPLDFSHEDEYRDDLPTLLKANKIGKLTADVPSHSHVLPAAKPAMKLFMKPTKPTLDEEQRLCRLRKERQTQRLPYKRYLAILPLMDQLKLDQDAREYSEQQKRRLCPSDIKLETGSTEISIDPDDIYKLPLQERLKRQPETQPDEEAPHSSKRFKKDENAKPAAKSQPSNVPVNDKSKTENDRNAKEDMEGNCVIEVPDSSEDDIVEVPIMREEQPKQTALSKNQKRRQRFKAKKALPAQSSNRPVQNFDYKNVDYKQFQGGAKRARGTEIKTQMHGKNRPNNQNMKQLNKIFSFSTIKKEGKK